ncbi:unnamed protein product [Ixodes persulcatus]
MFTWTPDEKTPDIVYYQCFTHYYLGWKILVKDPGTPDEPIASKTDTPGDPMTPKHDSQTPEFGSLPQKLKKTATITIPSVVIQPFTPRTSTHFHGEAHYTLM